MTSAYTIRYDILAKQYDTQFPILLHHKSISPQEYFYTLSQTNLLVQDAFTPVLAFRKKYYLLILILFILVILSFIIPFFSIIYDALGYTILFSIPFFVIFFIITFSGALILTNKTKEYQMRLTEQMKQWLETENQRLYYAKGIQLLYGNNSFTNYNIYQTHPMDIQILVEPTFSFSVPILNTSGDTNSQFVNFDTQVKNIESKVM